MAPATHTTEQRLQELRLRLAVIQRAYNPNQPRDGRGRFGSTGEHALPSVSTEAEAHRHAAAIARAGGAHSDQHQCAWCSRMTTGPMAGKRLGFVLRYGNWSHGICKSCNRRMMVPYYVSKGYSEQDAEKWVDLIFRGKATPAEALAAMQHNNGGEQRAMCAQFAGRLAAIRMQVASVVRNATWTDAHGNTWEVIQGAGGKFEQVILLSHGPGQAHVAPPVGTKLGVHEASRMLREKAGLQDEVRFERVGKLHDNLVPQPGTYNMPWQFEPGTKGPGLARQQVEQLHTFYGDHQLGAALSSRFDLESLRNAARDYGLSPKGTKDALVTAIVAHVTRDEATGIPRYSADFGKNGSAMHAGEDIHATARRLQQEQGLPKEKQPGESLEPRHTVMDSAWNIAAAPDFTRIQRQYEDDQLGNALSRYTLGQLKEGVKAYNQSHPADPIVTKGILNDHAELLSAITAKVTGGRYSADFRTAGRTGAKSEFDSRGIHRKLTSDESASAGRDHEHMLQALNGHTGVVAPNGVPLGEWDDPQKLWEYAHGDPERVYRLLSMYPQLWGMHEFITQVPRFADVAARFKGFSRNATAQEMTEALDRHFNGNKASWGRNGRAMQATTEHPDLEPYRRELARLHQQYRDLLAARPDLAKQLEAHQKTAASGEKATGSKRKESDHYTGADLVPISSATGYQINVYGPPETDKLLSIYGEAQLPKALSLFTTGKLLEAVTNMMAEHPGTKPASRTKREDLIAYLVQQATHPGQGATKAVRGGKTLADLTVLRHVRDSEAFNPYVAPNPRTLRTMYGDEQFHDALSAQSLPTLRAMAREYAGVKSGTKDVLIAAIEKWTLTQPLFPSVPMAEFKSAKPGDTLNYRTTIADLAARYQSITAALMHAA